VDVGEEEAKKLALQMEKVKPYVEGREVAKVIYVPGKLVNIVVK
jgi:leucyl-tRNA synthetase